MNINKYTEMFREAEADPEYWLAIPQTEFLEDVVRRMEEQGLHRAALAERLGSSRAWITKLLRGDANLTLLTMVKVSMALGGVLHMSIADRGMIGRWRNFPANAALGIGSIPGRPIGTPVGARNEQANDQVVAVANMGKV